MLEKEVKELTEMAEQADAKNEECVLNLPDEITRCQQRKRRLNQEIKVIKERCHMVCFADNIKSNFTLKQFETT